MQEAAAKPTAGATNLSHIFRAPIRLVRRIGVFARRRRNRADRSARGLPTARLAVAGILLLALSAVSVGVATWRSRQDLIQDSLADARAVSAIISHQLETAVDAIDGTLIDLLGHIRRASIAEETDLKKLGRNGNFRETVRQLLVAIPAAANVTVHTASGEVAWTTVATSSFPAKDADIPLLRELRQVPSDEVSISLPMVSRMSGRHVIPFTRKILSPSGQWIGALVVTIPISYFERIFEPTATIKSMRVALLHRDGRILVSYPETQENIGRQLPATSPWHALIAKDGGQFRASVVFGPDPVWVTAKTLPDYPLVLNIAIPEATILENWYRGVPYTVVGAGTLLVLATFLLWAALRQVDRLAHSKANLLKSEAELRDKTRTLEEKSLALQMSNMRFDTALNNMSQGLCMFDAARRLVVCNKQYADLYGLTNEQTKPGTSLREILEHRVARGAAPADHESYINDTFLVITENKRRQIKYTLEDGRFIAVVHQPMAGGGWVATHEDITIRHRSEQQIAYMARHDLLTGLFNRTSLAEKISDAAARYSRHGEAFTVMLLDLDRFKQVNDTLGHPAGDLLLQETAKRLRATLRETDVLARFGGDEFAIVQTCPGDQPRDAIALTERIIAALDQPYDIDGQAVTISTSIGIVFAPEHGTEADELIKHADLALYRAKSAGRNGYSIFAPDMTAAASARRQLEDDLRQALDRDEFELYYQPFVDAHDTHVCGAEALLRWKHPRHGLVAPMEFIPLAEETGLIERIGRWVLHAACAEAARWPDHLKVAVNLSPVQFTRGGVIESVAAALAESGLPASRLELEITESVFLDGGEANISTMKRLKALGVSLALDDFGTGYSSLSYLATFPFDNVKIDKSFTLNLTKRSDCAAIIASVMTLARCLNVTTTAEGVETHHQYELLRGAGVTYCQGFLFGRPRAARELRFVDAKRAAA